MPVTIKKIAQMLDLSPATVSLALNGSPLVADKTRERVKTMADELDYVPNNFGRGLQSRRSRLIGYMCSTVVNSFNSETMEGSGMVAAANNYGVLTGFAGRQFEHFDQQLQLFLEKHVDGIILALDSAFDGEKFPGFIRKVKQREVPVLLCATDSVNVDFPSVLTDNYRGGYMAVEYMVKQGHRSLIIPTDHLPFNRNRGHLAACRDYGLPEPLRSNDEPADIVALVQEHPEVTGIVTTSDYVAATLIWHMRSAGIRVPEDVSILGFDDVWYAERYEYNLSTVAQQRSALGRLSMQTMLNMVDGEGAKKVQLIEPGIVVRGTTAPPNPRKRVQ